ncbi:MAG: GH3 auxin-responsive promoter family protein, partial [Planctomycetes bacterium]|nr:GH3 auxin-responsive promoter family protein [Planctomycetota bacterium]
MDKLTRLLLWFKMRWVAMTAWRDLMEQARDPRRHQLRLLMSILKRSQDTTFGTERQFESVNSYEAFAERVEVQDYESLRPYIERQERDKTPELNPESPLLYAQTSGTTGSPKLVPILEHTVDNYKRSQGIVTYANTQACPGIYGGKILAITSPHVEGELETGTAFGSMSGLLSKSMPRLTRQKYVLPSAVLDIENYQAKYYLISAFALAARDISFIGTANPSTVMKLAETITQHQGALLEDVRSGRLSDLFGLGAAQLQAIQASFQANPGRADELEAIFASAEGLSFHALWPELKALSVWTGGSVGALIPEVERLLGSAVSVIELGYLSSEFRGSINVDPEKNLCIPTIHECFFEFVPVAEHGEADQRFLLVDELELGEQYH